MRYNPHESHTSATSVGHFFRAEPSNGLVDCGRVRLGHSPSVKKNKNLALKLALAPFKQYSGPSTSTDISVNERATLTCHVNGVYHPDKTHAYEKYHVT